MVMTICIHCGKEGGRFRWTGDGYVHTPQCDVPQKRRDDAKNLWDFSTMHLHSNPNYGPLHVGSLRDLRQLEKAHGVISVVGNYNEQNWSK
jgi:hypothetical protein